MSETIVIHAREGATEYGLDETVLSAAAPGIAFTPREVLRD
jgi:hypothetical protein